MMEMQQMEEMARREAEIQALQEQRLDIIRRALQDRDMETKFVNEQRMEELRDRTSVAAAVAADRTQRERIRELRKIAVARQRTARPAARDIIHDYADHASETYAPLRREGRRVDRDASKYETTYLQDMKYQAPPPPRPALPATAQGRPSARLRTAGGRGEGRGVPAGPADWLARADRPAPARADPGARRARRMSSRSRRASPAA
jgi:hypothetical protein